MDIRINFESDTPIYMQLKNEIIRGIAEGSLKNGDSLPSVRSLAEDIGINLHTVNKVYTLLKSEGFLIIDRRKGAIISIAEVDEAEKLRLGEDLQIVLNEFIAKGISKEEIIEIINIKYRGK